LRSNVRDGAILTGVETELETRISRVKYSG
jgi:hypothetical protein